MARQHHQLTGHESEQALGGGEGQGSLACCSPWGHRELDTTEQLNNNNKDRVALVVKNPPPNAGDVRDAGSIPGWERSPRGGHGNPLQYSCLESPMNRAAW